MTPNRLAALACDHGIATVVCLGTGGVGKTTTAAAVAAYAASHGRPALVVTVDPAARLAQIMGSSTHDGSPLQPWLVPGIPGLSMVQLDTSAVFDAAVQDALPSAQAQSLINNNYYRLVADAFAGSADYMAAELVGRLRARIEQTGELLVIDTAPATSAFEFLDAPTRLAAFTDSRFVRTLRGMGEQARGSKVTRTLLAAVLGAELTEGVAELLSSLHGALVHMRDRAVTTLEHLRSDSTAFTIITRPAADQIEPARLAAENLRTRGYRLSTCVVNQMPQPQPLPEMPDSALHDLIRDVESLALPAAPAIADGLRLLREQHRIATVMGALADSLGSASGADIVRLPRMTGLMDAHGLAALIQSGR